MTMEKNMTDTALRDAANLGQPERPGSAFAPFLRFCRCIVSRYERWLQRQDLAELDDHLLRDIGISPNDVARECAKPFWRR
jgi:uncharacterized protein YjiS (DUF1127 family)